MNYRIANHSDTKGIAKLLVDTWNNTYSNILSRKVLQKRTYKYVEENWRPRIKALTKKDMMVIAETEQENIVGITWARTEKLNPTKSLFEATRFEGELMAIYVLKDYQKKRIGTNLVHYIVNFLLKNKVKSMLVWVFKDNPNKNFYIHLGAKYIGDEYLNLDGENYLESAYGWTNIEKIISK